MKKPEKPRDQVLGHGAEADGIEEYDNPLPDWWLGLFWFTIIWGIAYTLHYHVIADRSQTRELAAEIAAAEAKWPAVAPQTDFAVTTELAQQGASVYKTNCIACHGPTLEGGIGPNLKDNLWLHGDSQADIVTTISDGVAAKGMPAWGPILGAERVRQVAAYILTQQTDD